MKSRKITLPAEEARDFVAKSFSDGYPSDHIDALIEAGHAFLEVAAELGDDGSYDVSVAAPTGVMVGWFLDEWTASKIALPGGEPASDLHLTLAYLGEASAMTLDDQRKLIGIVSEVANRNPVLTGTLNSFGRFTSAGDTEPLWVGVDLPGLAKVQKDLVEALKASGLPVSEVHDFSPHITVAYVDSDTPTPAVIVDPYDIRVCDLTVAIAGARHSLDLVDEQLMPDVESYIGAAYRPDLTKAIGEEAEDRFTLGPWYVPDQVDAHGDFTDAKQLQKALWGYVKNASREIKLQHNREVRAGEWVEAMTWPFAVEVPLTKADGTTMMYKYPPNTPFLGVQWEPWAWELVKAGKLRGYSIGGTGNLIEVDLEVDKASR
jgi:hypothetical protein